MDTSSWVEPSWASTIAFAGVLALVVGCFIAAMARSYEPRARGALLGAVGAGAWLAVTGGYVLAGLTRAGVPGLVGFFVLSNLGAVVFAFSPVGTRLIRRVPLAALAAFHVFRLPLELVLHSWGEQGTMPVQMTLEGHNFDIVTGILALGVGVYALATKKDPPRWMLFVFNTVGTALLLAVIAIVLLSPPLPLQRYDGPPILLALYLPYAWIAPVCVAGALAAHLMLWRALAAPRINPSR